MRNSIFACLFILSFFFQTASAQSGLSDTNFAKIQSLMQILNEVYVEPVNQNKLTEDAIRGVLKELDPHSYYIPAKRVQSMNEPLKGNFEGVGIQFQILFDTIMVVTPISGGPSEKLGIMSGDKIITIDGETVAGNGIDNGGVAKRLRGEKGSKVVVEIFRRGESELIEFTITRDKIPLYSVEATYMATDKVGYVRISHFAASTNAEFLSALNELEDQGMESLILDLRGNGGGYLTTAQAIADAFLRKNQMIVNTKGKNGLSQDRKASGYGKFKRGKLAVLIDEGSASASEIVSGAVQDWDRGVIIGRRSFGKGLVQQEYPLIDGSAVRITIAKYYTPTGRCIQKPYVDGEDAYNKEINARFTSGELVNMDSIKFPDSLKYFTPNRRIVYGGGGIIPDIFIPLDTSKATKLYSQVLRKGIVNQFTLIYANDNRDNITSIYADVDEFYNKFPLGKLYKEFIEYAEKQGIETDKSEINKTKTDLEKVLAGLIARNVWDGGAYFQIVNKTDPTFLKAIEILQNTQYDEILAVKN